MNLVKNKPSQTSLAFSMICQTYLYNILQFHPSEYLPLNRNPHHHFRIMSRHLECLNTNLFHIEGPSSPICVRGADDSAHLSFRKQFLGRYLLETINLAFFLHSKIIDQHHSILTGNAGVCERILSQI